MEYRKEHSAYEAIDASDVALIFEGGGMRAAYTTAVLATLLEEGIRFPKAYGISAGSVLAVDYAAQDLAHAKAVFIEVGELRRASGIVPFLAGEGFCNTQYVFEGLAEMAAGSHSEWHFDIDTFRNGPTDVHIEAFNRNTGHTQVWTRDDMHTLTQVMERVAASCSYPLATAKAIVDGEPYIDGGMGHSYGICLHAAKRDGFKRFFIVRTRPRDFRLPQLSLGKRALYRVAYAKSPHVYKALCARPTAYNRLLDEIDREEAAGHAYVFCPEVMPVTYMTTDHRELMTAYNAGLAQCRHELPAWREWLRGGTEARS